MPSAAMISQEPLCVPTVSTSAPPMFTPPKCTAPASTSGSAIPAIALDQQSLAKSLSCGACHRSWVPRRICNAWPGVLACRTCDTPPVAIVLVFPPLYPDPWCVHLPAPFSCIAPRHCMIILILFPNAFSAYGPWYSGGPFLSLPTFRSLPFPTIHVVMAFLRLFASHHSQGCSHSYFL